MGMKMNRVLIIDDEILTIKYLKSLHSWEKFGCGDILYAVTIAAALDIFQREAPQIVFVDVRMPGMDGLELSRRLLLENPGVSIVIMTAYQEFDYVKEAMEMGIKYFLVKHEITEDTLDEVLQKISDGFLSKKRYEQMMENDWLRKVWDGERTDNVRLLQGADRCFLAMMVLTGLSVFTGNKEPVYLKEERIRELSPSGIRVRGFTRQGFYTYVMICEYEKPVSEKENYRILAHFTRALGERCRMDSGLTPVFFLSAAYEAYESLKSVCPVMRRYCDCVLAQREGVVWEEMLSGYEKLFPEKLEPERKPEVWSKADISSMLSKIKDGSYYMEIKDFTHLRQYLRAGNFVSFLEGEEKEIPIVCLEQLLRACLRYYECQEEEKGAGNRIVRKTLDYIHGHYAEDISSTMIAESLGISDGYLRFLFKREMDCTVKDYILRCRVEQARHLLLENKKKIYEIAAECGFVSSQHFSRVFRQITGIAPGEFKQQDGGGDIGT